MGPQGVQSSCRGSEEGPRAGQGSKPFASAAAKGRRPITKALMGIVGKRGVGLTCTFQGQLAHVSGQLPHAHGLRVPLDVWDSVAAASAVTGDEVRVGGLDLHHVVLIALLACGDRAMGVDVRQELQGLPSDEGSPKEARLDW